jgi:hypothetical protein
MEVGKELTKMAEKRVRLTGLNTSFEMPEILAKVTP